MLIIRSRAPFRISFAGGGTDIPSWSKEHGGQVISTTIDKYIYITAVFPEGNNNSRLNAQVESEYNEKHESDIDKYIKIHAYDLGIEKRIPINELDYNGEFDLIKAVIKYFKIQSSVELHIHSDLPAASGMGTSSSLVVALISLFSHYTGKDLSKEEIAQLACKIEREELKQAGGYQDQYAAAYGGLNFITFDECGHVYPIKVDQDFKNELNYRMILFYTGKTHDSAALQHVLLKNYGKLQFVEGMNKLKSIAQSMKEILESNDLSRLDEWGKLQHEAWIAKKMTSSKISNELIEKLYIHALENGGLGGKILGAGGGGYLLVFIKPTMRMKLINTMESLGVESVNFHFESEGVTSWIVK